MQDSYSTLPDLFHCSLVLKYSGVSQLDCENAVPGMINTNSRATSSVSAVLNSPVVMPSIQQLIQSFAPSSLQPSTSVMPSPPRFPFSREIATTRDPLAEVRSDLPCESVDIIVSDIPLPVHRNIRSWKKWLSNKVVAHAIRIAAPVDHVSITAPDIETGSTMLWQYLRSALGENEGVVLSDLPGNPGTKAMNNFPLWALFQEEDSVWNMYGTPCLSL